MQTQMQLRSSLPLRIAQTAACVLVVAATVAGCTAAAQSCRPQVLEGEVTRGRSWLHPISSTLDLKLEAVPAGWMIRVLPHGRERAPHDAAELANPPYRSPTPILVSTDFAFRAQDAVAWNPRTFRFFMTAGQAAEAERIYQAILRDPNRPEVGAGLFLLLAQAPEATLAIVDAEIIGGTANQTAAAATVASHFDQTAHTVRTEAAGSPLGSLLKLRFRFTVPALAADCRR